MPAPALGPEWLDPANIITAFVGWIGPWAIVGVMLVIFAETGLLVGFFLPGDSLLFTLGMFVAIGESDPSSGVPVHIWIAAPLVWLAAICGNQPVQAGVRRAHRRLLRQARGQGHHPGPVRPDRAHLHPRHGRSRQDALQPLPRVQRPGRDLLGLRHHLARLLPGQYHLDPEEHRPHDPRDRLRLGHPDAHRGPAQALRRRQAPRRRHAEPRQQAGGEAGPTTARVRSGAGRERSEAAPAPDAHQRPLRQHVVRIQ